MRPSAHYWPSDIGHRYIVLRVVPRQRRAAGVQMSSTASDISQSGADRTTPKLARWAGSGWLRRVRRGLFITVPGSVDHPDLGGEDAQVDPSVVWDRCYFTGW